MSPRRTVPKVETWKGGPFRRRADRPQPSPAELAETAMRRKRAATQRAAGVGCKMSDPSAMTQWRRSQAARKRQARAWVKREGYL